MITNIFIIRLNVLKDRDIPRLFFPSGYWFHYQRLKKQFLTHFQRKILLNANICWLCQLSLLFFVTLKTNSCQWQHSATSPVLFKSYKEKPFQVCMSVRANRANWKVTGSWLINNIVSDWYTDCHTRWYQYQYYRQYWQHFPILVSISEQQKNKVLL